MKVGPVRMQICGSCCSLMICSVAFPARGFHRRTSACPKGARPVPSLKKTRRLNCLCAPRRNMGAGARALAAGSCRLLATGLRRRGMRAAKPASYLSPIGDAQRARGRANACRRWRKRGKRLYRIGDKRARPRRREIFTGARAGGSVRRSAAAALAAGRGPCLARPRSARRGCGGRGRAPRRPAPADRPRRAGSASAPRCA